jgi:signal peptidase I
MSNKVDTGELLVVPPFPWAAAVAAALTLGAGFAVGLWCFAHRENLWGGLAIAAGFGLVWAMNRNWPGLRERHLRKKARRDARHLIKSSRKLINRHARKIKAPDGAQRLEMAMKRVEEALKARPDAPGLGSAVKELDELLDRYLAFARKSPTREYVESIGVAVLIALLLRAFVIEAFKIPSGSMIPTLMVGDHIFVNKYIYGLRIPFADPAKNRKVLERAPNRGDVIVFTNPREPDKDFIKRVVGLPGDRLEIRGGVLHINGKPQERAFSGEYVYEDYNEYTRKSYPAETRLYREKIDGRIEHAVIQRKDAPVLRDEGPWYVQPGHIFVMGDNRDNSADSRAEGGPGQIPFSYIKGRAMFVWLSLGGPYGIRFSRLGRTIE